jgi:hypothetical protein
LYKQTNLNSRIGTAGTSSSLKILTCDQNNEHDLRVFRDIRGQNVSTKVTNMKPRDLSQVLKNAPAGEWIALSSDQTRMIGHGVTVDEAVEAAKLAGEDKPVLLKMPLPNVGIAASIY